MKKLITSVGIIGTSISALVAPVLAAPIPVGITPPIYGANGDSGNIGKIIGNLVTIIIIIAVIAVLFMLVFGAFEWITSGGDKDAIAKARGRILNALIGLVIIALAFLLFSVAGSIVGIDFKNLSIPTLTQ